MNSWLRTFLTDKRSFRLAIGILAAFFVIGAAFIVVLMTLMQKIGDRSVRDTLGAEAGRTIQVLNDEANVPFLPFVEALNSLDGDLSIPAVRKMKLDSLSHLPGVTGAMCLIGRSTMEKSLDAAPPLWLSDSLRDLCGHFFGVKKDIAQSVLARAKFRIYRNQPDTLWVAADSYDSLGHRIVRVMGGKKYKADDVAYLFAVTVDPQWIRNALVEQMERARHSKDALILLNFPEEYGLGVITGDNSPMQNEGHDTLWWYGLRSISGKNRFSYLGDWSWSSNNWFKFRALSEVPNKSLSADPDTPLLSKVIYGTAPVWIRFSPYAACFLLLGSGTVFLASLVQMRKQWLSRQVALEHLSHSIKTPVARLRLNTDTLLESRVVSPEVERDVVQSIGRECGRLERAVQNAALAIREGGLKPHVTPFELREMLNELCDTWKPVFVQQKIALNLDVQGAGTGTYDRDLLAVLFDNLIDNALRHSRLNNIVVEKGRANVTIRLSESAGKVIAKVCDTGAGIHPKDLKRIFRAFERGRDKALTGASGLGLGLSLSKEIAEVHGGTITAQNGPEGGACLVVMLPRHPSAF
jgi:hypothetical protein